MSLSVLIVANSGRMLAQQAKNIGYSPIVIDCYGDQDMQVCTLESIQIINLDLKSVKPALLFLKNKHSLCLIIYGSGFELYPDSLQFLHQQQIQVAGNCYQVFSAIQDKQYFFSRLDKLNIRYPDISFDQSKYGQGWLLKPKRGEGGIGIKNAQLTPTNLKDSYWQKIISGRSLSVLFFAQTQKIEVIGFHRQLQTQIGDEEYIFLGLIILPYIEKIIATEIKAWLLKISAEFSLKGINSLDFMVKDQQCYVLEVNPRPSASMQLYNSVILQKHIANAMQAEDPDIINQTVLNIQQGYMIIYADRTVQVANNIDWPDWTLDRPKKDSIINTGKPICSIIARNKNEQQVIDLLFLRQQIILNYIGGLTFSDENFK